MSDKPQEKTQSESAVTKLPTAFLQRIEAVLVSPNVSDSTRREIRTAIVNSKTPEEAEAYVKEKLGLVRGENEVQRHG